MEKTDHGNVLTPVQGIPNIHHSLSSQGLKHQCRIETWKITIMRLPSPVLILFVRPAVLLAGQLRLYVRTFRFLVERPS
uniref:Uncharacterized protein n=1 Tax=Rhizophora mucronata TaxID=61149 RepID=A0A2P2Q9I4_RHIMU